MLKLLLQAVLLLFAAGSAAVAQTPWLFGMNFNQMDAGGPTITTPITGRGFASGAVAYWGTTPLPTTFIDTEHLQVTIASNLTALCGEFYMVVKNPNGAITNSVPHYVQPVLLSIGPAVPKRPQSATVIATGRGFVPSNTLELSAGQKWGLTTTYISSTTLTAVVPAELAATSAQATVFVLDWASKAFSRNVTLIIGTPPILNSISPTETLVDGPSLTLTITGSGFLPGAAAQWSGSRLPTAFVNSTQLLATIDASLLRRSVVSPNVGIGVNVVNPDGGFSSSQWFYVKEISPTISKLEPPSAFAGGPTFTLDVSGTGYYSGSQVTFSGVQVATQFINSTRLTATVPSSLIAATRPATVSVINGVSSIPMFNGPASLGVAFPIKPPVLGSTMPASVKAGAPAFTLTASGEGFFPGHSIRWNNLPLTTQYVSPTQLSAMVDAGRVAAPGSATVTVTTAGGVVSNPIEFRIDPLPPFISSLSPAFIAAGSGAFTLTVRGTNFANGAVVQWNGTALPTSFISPAEVSATVGASLVSRSAPAMISVVTSGGVSNPAPFSVTAALPTVDTGGVVNAFSGRPTIAPGCLVTIYGTNLATRPAAAEAYPLPMALLGTSVRVNGKAAPLLYASPNQVNVQVPFETMPGAGALVIDANGAESATIPITVADTAPGALKMPQSDHAVAVNYPSGTLNSTDNPAHPGDYIIAYMTGQGRLDNVIATGEAAPDAPFFVPVARVEAKVGGLPAEIGFVGLAPGYAGLLQLNLKVPDIGPGERVFEVSIGGVPSNATVLSIGESQPHATPDQSSGSDSRR